MRSIQEYTRSGSHKGIEFDVEIWQFDTGEIMVQAVHVEGFRPRKLSDGHHKTPTTIEDAYQIGAQLARELIDAP